MQSDIAESAGQQQARGGRRRAPRRRGRPPAVRAGGVTLAAAALAAVALSGCAKMDAALDKQWMTVDFNPGTSVATALHVRAACSHIQDTPPQALPASHSAINVMYGVSYNTTNSSPAELSQLQTCLQKFSSVQGVDPESAGDEGS